MKTSKAQQLLTYIGEAWSKDAANAWSSRAKEPKTQGDSDRAFLRTTPQWGKREQSRDPHAAWVAKSKFRG